MSGASDMLAAALERMDGIIAGSKAMEYSGSLFGFQSPTSPFVGEVPTMHLLEELRAVLEVLDPEEREGLRCQIPESTAESLMEWLQGPLVPPVFSTANGHIPVGGIDQYQDRLLRLESNRESLVLQVSVLTDQVEVQGEKIRDLDLCLEEHREKLNSTEALLQQELHRRMALEKQKLNLQAEVASLRLELTAREKQYLDYEHRSRDSQDLLQEVVLLREKVAEMEREREKYEAKLSGTQEELAALNSWLENSGSEDKGLNSDAILEGAHEEEGTGDRVLAKRMERKMKSLEAESEEKDHGIEQLLVEIRHGQDQAVVIPGGAKDDDNDEGCHRDPVAVRTPAPVSEGAEEQTQGSSEEMEVCEMARGSVPLPQASPTGPAQESFGTKKIRSSFGRGLFRSRRGKMAASAPHRETEGRGSACLTPAGLPSNSTQTFPRKQAFGIRKLLGRMKRNESVLLTLDKEASEGEFKRGGVRATAGPRLGWSRDLQGASSELDTPFARWSKEQVYDWLKELGLGVHVGVARQWVTSGQTLLQASQQDLDRELGIKHPLHRKKLQLALQALGSEEEDNKGKLHYGWVTTWLDDIGLPQYKAQFEEGRVDGRMLHYMTVDDLLSLKVVSVLHHLSMKRAIQLLRLNDYQPACLSRRPSELADVSPAEVCCWTNHRVMEWLRSVDLAEYAPNLRGSGVHGALMVLEPRFTVETLALLLNIPPNKTLLRRHLATHFQLLVGVHAQRSKQEQLESAESPPLTATAKVKPRRLLLGGFGSLRRRRQEEMDEYVCPMDVEMPRSCRLQAGQRGLDLRPSEDELGQLQQMEDSEGTMRQIGAFSEGINNLTSLLQKDPFLREFGSQAAGLMEDSSV